MNVVKQHYIIDLSSNNNFVQVPAVQADGNETRYAELELIANHVPYVVDSETTDVTIIGTKPDGTEVWNYCEVTNEGYILVEITYEMTTAPGRGNFQIMLLEKGTNNSLKSFPFYLIITPKTYDRDYILSSNEFGVLAEMIEEVEEIGADIEADIVRAETAATNAETSATNASNSASAASTSASNAATSATISATSATNASTSATNANTEALKSEGYAVGTQNGTPVSSGTYYHNNSKYYAEQGDALQQDAEAWARGTKGGTPVPSTDPTYNNNAKYYADQASAIVGIGIATTTTPGIVKPDGDTITVANDGKIAAPSGKYNYNSSTECLTLYMSAQA